MPAGFDMCREKGGRIRTKSLGDNKYMHVCFLDGKSYPGYVKTKEQLTPEDLKDIYTEEVTNMNDFKESLIFSFKEGSINEEKRTVRVCALATCVSKNGRFYSPKVVESVSGTLVGKKSFADHDQRDTKNLIGRIVNEEYKDGRLYADIKVSHASGIAKQTWEKLKDGTITDVSIAADGKSKRIKLGEQMVDEVTELAIHSVDFVTEGGVQDAKVMQVFENIETIPTISEVKEEMTEQEKLESMDSCMKGMVAKGKSKEMAQKSCKMMVDKGMRGSEADYTLLIDTLEESHKEEIATLTKAKEDAEFKLIEKELAEHKISEISKLETTDKVKEMVTKKVVGKTKEEISASIKSEFDYIKSVMEVVKEVKNPSIPAAEAKKQEDTTPKVWNKERIMNEAKIAENLKVKCVEVLTLEGSAKMLEFLKSRGIEI